MIQPSWDNLAESTQRNVNGYSQSQRLQEAYEAGYNQALNERIRRLYPGPGGTVRDTPRQDGSGLIDVYDENGNYLGTTDPRAQQSYPSGTYPMNIPSRVTK